MEITTVISRLELFCVQHSICVRRKFIVQSNQAKPNQTRGVSYIGHIELRKGLELHQELATFLHELGHELMHSSRERQDPNLSQFLELEADQVAWIVTSAVGCIQPNWMRHTEEPTERVVKTAERLARFILNEARSC